MPRSARKESGYGIYHVMMRGINRQAIFDDDEDCRRFVHILADLPFQHDKGETIYVPTGIGLLLFGKRPELVYNNAVIRATFKTEGKKEDIETINGPLVEQPGKIFKWYKDRIGRQIDRSEPGRKYLYDYPIEVINELVKNAILHRDYDIKGAPIYLEINDDAIIIKSPGYAVPPKLMRVWQA